MEIYIPISVGELLDKISILQIKTKYTKSSYVLKELEDLTQIAHSNQVYSKEYLEKLSNINSKLWNIEDELRIFEEKHIFDEDFITLARLVYTYNDQRALIKKEINEFYNSKYQEIKCYV